MNEPWSVPDASGIRTRTLDVGARSTLRGRRQRQCDELNLEAAALWPAAWRDLACDWLRGSATSRWRTLLEKAGHRRSVLAGELLEALLQAGWIMLEESREQGRWVPIQLSFRDLEPQREALGLPHRERLSQQRAQLLQREFSDPALDAAARTLQGLPAALAIRRHRWLEALQHWQADARNGTRRDFALFAAGDTKGLPDADWRWLGETLELATLGVEAHTPQLQIRAPLPLTSVPDFIGLTPATIAAGSGLHGKVTQWRLLENRTSFERAARRHGAQDGVVWLPGYPAHWWQESIRHLLALHPAPALIACDPDPAGIEIALSAGALWESAGLTWQPWQMDAGALQRLPKTKPLSDDDRQRLTRLLSCPLPQTLLELAQAMLASGLKGEQEGLPDL